MKFQCAQDFNAGGFNAAGTPKRAKVTTVPHFSNAGGDFNAGGQFQRQRISTPNSGIEDPLGARGVGEQEDSSLAYMCLRTLRIDLTNDGLELRGYDLQWRCTCLPVGITFAHISDPLQP